MSPIKSQTSPLTLKIICLLLLLTGLLLFPARAQTAWQNIPLTGSGGAPLYNYATLLARTILFYDANHCGPGITGNNRFNWRGDCHVNDGANLTLSNGSTIWLDATGGYHDAGDHIKFGITNAYAAATLGWGFFEFREEYEAIGQDEWLLRAVKWATDYFIKCHPEANTFLYSVGSDADHNYWGPPELQLDSRSPRDIIVCTPSNPASDVCGSTAAALALMSVNYRDRDPAYAELCLQHAREIFSLGRNNLGLSDGLSFYPPSIYWDDLAWGAICLYVASGESRYLDEFNTIIGPDCAGLDKDNDRENGINWENKWGHCWDAVWAGAFVMAARATAHPTFIDHLKNHLGFWMNELAETPAGLKFLNSWGSLRYATATALTALAFYNSFPEKANEVYRDFGASQISYTLGSNPLNRCYIVGCGANSPQHPHHDAAHGSDTGFLDDPPEHKHVLYGALAGGPGLDDQHNDLVDDYVQNEVSIDYNAGCVGALAGMRRFFGPGTMPEADPAPEPPIENLYVEARIEKDTGERTQVTVHIHNHSVHPPHFETSLSYRYFINLSEVFNQGYDLSHVKLEVVVNENSAGVLTPGIQPWDELNQIYYVEVSYPDVLLYNRREFQFGLIFVTPNFLGQWDSSNDFSREGMTTSLAKNDKIALYRGGELVWGNQPYKDLAPPAVPAGLTATAIGSFQINLDWNDNREGDLDHYNIYQSRTTGFVCNNATLAGSATGSAFAATDLTRETAYYFKVTAVDGSMNESAPSAEVSATTLTPDSIPPVAPTGLLVTGSGSTTINLDWNDNRESDLSKYRVYRGTSSGFVISPDTFAGDSQFSRFTDTGLNPRTGYYYKVIAVDTSANPSPASAEVSGKTLAPPPPELRAQYKCTNTGSSVAEIRFDTYLFNDGEQDLTLSDITIRYWFTAEPPLGGLEAVCDYADVGHDKPVYRFGNAGDSQYLEIGFSETALVPTWLGGTGSANSLPAGARTGEIQNRFGDRGNSGVPLNQTNDWSFDSSLSTQADWNRVTVHYQGDVLCWGTVPGGSQPGLTGDVNGSGTVDIIDALMTAQYYVGLNPQGFNTAVADVNRDNAITIVDALIIARYYVGLVAVLPV